MAASTRLKLQIKCALFFDFRCLFQDRTCSRLPLLTPRTLVIPSHGSLTQVSPTFAKEELSSFKACSFLKDTWERFSFCYKLFPHPEIYKKGKERATKTRTSSPSGNLGTGSVRDRAPGVVVALLRDAALSPIFSHLYLAAQECANSLNHRLPPLQSLMI